MGAFYIIMIEIMYLFLLRLSILEYKMDKPRQTDLLGLTSNILSAHVSNNPTATSELI